jgi:hypothetical protein
MPRARTRLAGEAAFLVLVALGLALGGFSWIVIAAGTLAALVLVVLFEFVSRKEAARAAATAGKEPIVESPPAVEPVEVPPVEPPPAEREATVDERSARSILASSPPPLPPDASRPKRVRRLVERRRTPPEPSPPEAVAVTEEPAREWNLWELERAVRDSADESRREEWNALFIHLREFANADGDLPLEFDGLVRESFAGVLAVDREAAAAP